MIALLSQNSQKIQKLDYLAVKAMASSPCHVAFLESLDVNL